MKSSSVKASLFVATAAVLVLAASACGGGDKEKSTPAAGKTVASTPSAAKTPAGAEVTPAAVSTLSPRSGDFASLCQKSGEKQFSAPPPAIIDPKLSYTAVIKTDKGDITVELYPDVAPVTVNNFVFLACKGFYDGVTWHRVIPGFVAQTGDPTGTGSGGPGYEIPDEISSRSFEQGTLGMANRGPDTNGSQFFICYEAQPALDGRYTVFGKVTAGLDVLGKITPRDPSTSSNLPPGDKVLEITVTEK
jgi:cyclophilin family peptidyl-prolyl cis-trans isomerase